MSAAAIAAEHLIRRYQPGAPRTYCWRAVRGQGSATVLICDLDGFTMTLTRDHGRERRARWTLELADTMGEIIDRAEDRDPTGVLAEAFDVGLAEWAAQADVAPVAT